VVDAGAAEWLTRRRRRLVIFARETRGGSRVRGVVASSAPVLTLASGRFLALLAMASGNKASAARSRFRRTRLNTHLELLFDNRRSTRTEAAAPRQREWLLLALIGLPLEQGATYEIILINPAPSTHTGLFTQSGQRVGAAGAAIASQGRPEIRNA